MKTKILLLLLSILILFVVTIFTPVAWKYLEQTFELSHEQMIGYFLLAVFTHLGAFSLVGVLIFQISNHKES